MDARVGIAGDGVLGERQRIAGALGCRQGEARVGHAERRPQPLLQEAPERLARHGLDDEAQHVGGEAVLPVAAGIEQQRRLGERGDRLLLGQPLRRPHRGAGVERVRRRRAAILVGETGGVPQQVLDRGDLLWRARAPARLGHLQLGQRRQVLRDRIAEQDPPLLHQHHDGRRGHGLGHGCDREHRIGLERLLGCRIAIADRLQVRELAAARDGDDAARHAGGLDLAAHGLAEATQSHRRQSNGLGLGAGDIGSGHGSTSHLG